MAVNPKDYQTNDAYLLALLIEATGGTVPTGGATSALQNTQQTTLLNILSKLADSYTSQQNSLVNLNELNIRLQAIIEKNLFSNITTTRQHGFSDLPSAIDDFDAFKNANPTYKILNFGVSQIYEPVNGVNFGWWCLFNS